MNAIAADDPRFDDLKERFTLVGISSSPDPIELADWKGRGITPIPYDAANDHSALLDTLERWADLSLQSGKKGFVEAEIKRIVQTNRSAANDSDRDLFDHFIRRSSSNERILLSGLASRQKADLGWLDSIAAIAAEHDRERR